MIEVPDKNLIEQYLKGNQGSLDILIERYLKPIYGFVYKQDRSSSNGKCRELRGQCFGAGHGAGLEVSLFISKVFTQKV